MSSAVTLVQSIRDAISDLYDMGYDYDITNGYLTAYCNNRTNPDPVIHKIRIPGTSLNGRYLDMTKR